VSVQDAFGLALLMLWAGWLIGLEMGRKRGRISGGRIALVGQSISWTGRPVMNSPQVTSSFLNSVDKP